MLAVVTVVCWWPSASSPSGGYVTAAMNDAELVESRHALNPLARRYRDGAQHPPTPAASHDVWAVLGLRPDAGAPCDGVVIGSAVFAKDGRDPLRPTSSARSKRRSVG